jgi:hypothetical protein
MGLGLEMISPLEAATNWGLRLAFRDEELRHPNCHGAVRVASLLCEGELYEVLSLPDPRPGDEVTGPMTATNSMVVTLPVVRGDEGTVVELPQQFPMRLKD